MQKKLIVMFTIVAGMLIGLIGRLMYIEYTSGEKYEKNQIHHCSCNKHSLNGKYRGKCLCNMRTGL